MTPEMMKEIWDKEGILDYVEYFWIDISILFNFFFKEAFSHRDASF